MIEMIYAFGFGFYCAYTACFVLGSYDEFLDNSTRTTLSYIPFLIVGWLIGRVFIHYTLTAIFVHYGITLAGAALGVLFGIYAEGTFTWLWRRIHPTSAPTEFIGAGKRGSLQKPPPKISAALMGTSTSAFAVQGLDVKTTALIKLSMYAFKRDRQTIVVVENSLKLGDGRRYYAYQKLVAEAQYDKDLKDIIHPYWRAINGNHSSARLMFTNLCQLARDSRNTNKRAVNRLVKIGQSLGLSPEDMGHAIRNVRA